MKNLKKKKTVLVLLLAAVMLFSSMSSSFAADNTISSTYFVNQDFSQLASLSKSIPGTRSSSPAIRDPIRQIIWMTRTSDGKPPSRLR